VAITRTTDGDVELVTISGPDLKRVQDLLTADLYGETKPGACVKCKDAFSSENVYTEAGRRETALSGLCERCWDAMFAEDDE
jgi:hypothetical protein